MENIFPALLDFSFFAPMLLRATLGLVLFRDGLIHLFVKRKVVRKAFKEFCGVFWSNWWWYLGLVEIAAALFLIAGLFTQLAAIVAGITALKLWLFRRSATLRPLAHHSGSAYFLIIAISLSLLLTGAGIFALDLPL